MKVRTAGFLACAVVGAACLGRAASAAGSAATTLPVSLPKGGSTVALSGTTAVVGGFGGQESSVSVFTRGAHGWSAPVSVSATTPVAGDYFGDSVAIDRDTIVVGALGDASSQGATYVFVRVNGVWTQQAKLVAPDGGPSQNFGSAVAVSGDTALVGARYALANRGAAYVFTRSGGGWNFQAELSAPDGAPLDWLGTKVGLSGDTAVAGAANRASNAGGAYVFSRTGSTWSAGVALAPPAPDAAPGAFFGSGIACTADTVLVGALGLNGNTGAAYVFTRVAGVWGGPVKISPTGGVAGDYFGVSAALDPDVAVIGASGANSATGAAHVFKRIAGAWAPAGDLSAPGGAHNDQFGASVAVRDGLGIVGAPGGNSGAGTAYAFAGLPIALPVAQAAGTWTGLAIDLATPFDVVSPASKLKLDVTMVVTQSGEDVSVALTLAPHDGSASPEQFALTGRVGSTYLWAAAPDATNTSPFALEASIRGSTTPHAVMTCEWIRGRHGQCDFVQSVKLTRTGP